MQRYSAFIAITAALALLVLIGIGLNRSLAGYGLVIPVLLGSLMIVIGRNRRWRGVLALSATLLLAVAVAGLALTGIGGGRFGGEATGTGKQFLARVNNGLRGRRGRYGSGRLGADTKQSG